MYMILIPVATYMIICWKAICQPSESYSKFTSPTMMKKKFNLQSWEYTRIMWDTIVWENALHIWGFPRGSTSVVHMASKTP